MRVGGGYVPPRPLREWALFVAAGIWIALILGYRMIERPELSFDIDLVSVERTYQVRYGIFVALAGAGLIVAAGIRHRAKRQPGLGLVLAGSGGSMPWRRMPVLDLGVHRLDHRDARVALRVARDHVPAREGLLVGAGDHVLDRQLVLVALLAVAPVLVGQLPGLERVLLRGP